MRRRPVASLLCSVATVAGLGAIGCGSAGSSVQGASIASLRGASPLLVDPTLRGARLVPEDIDNEKPLGTEPGGGVRGIASGVRVVTLPNGAVLSAEDRLPEPPRSITALPPRLGGGFLFAIATTVWRADKWLGPARPIFVANTDVSQVVVGLDRVYLRWSSGATQAIDPGSGAPTDIGAWPPGPNVGSYVALDGWRAVAVTDLRGPVATFDAGATWRPLDLPLDARELRVQGDGVLVGGADASRKTAWFEVRPDGQVGRVSDPSRPPSSDERATPVDPLAKPFGKRPLAAAIEDGWPLADGTAVVARDGELARIRIADGALIDLEPDAFALKPARCHPVPFGRRDLGGVAFVCGEPRGRTALYSFDAALGRLNELRTFTTPRLVLAAGNGALAIRGVCAEDGASENGDPKEQSYCLLPLSGGFREVALRGSIGGERVVLLVDGRLAVVSPPHGDLGAARLTVLDGERTSTRSIVFPPPSPEVARALRAGMWLDGFYEKRPGVLGGWVESQGTMLGVEIDLDGSARAGAYVRDPGFAAVSSTYGLGFSAAHHGYETTDGGMSWEPIELPEPIAKPRGAPGAAPVERGCGPIGCALAGWLRVGWGAKKQAPIAEPASAPKMARMTRPEISLACEPLRGAPIAAQVLPFTPTVHIDLGGPWGSFGRNTPLTTIDWSPLYGSPAPPLRTDELGSSNEVRQTIDASSSGPLARVYAWGSRGAEWDRTSRWTVRWVAPFGSSLDVFSSSIVSAPRVVTEASRFATGTALKPVSSWAIAVADDPRHALIAAHRSGDVAVMALEADRAPVDVRRADGEPFPDLEAAARIGGRWILATAQSGSELPATVVWVVDGGSARELARAPRAGVDGRGANPRLARRSDDRAVGLVVDGQPSSERTVPQRWVLGIDLDTGAKIDLEPLGDADLGRRDALAACNGDEPGWLVDVPWTGLPRVALGAEQGTRGLRATQAELRVSRNHACVERLFGALDTGATVLPRIDHAAVPRADVKHVDVSAIVARSRYLFRCTMH